MKLKNYSAAAQLAAQMPGNGQRELLTGIALLKNGRNDAAATLLGVDADLAADWAAAKSRKSTVPLPSISKHSQPAAMTFSR